MPVRVLPGSRPQSDPPATSSSCHELTPAPRAGIDIQGAEPPYCTHSLQSFDKTPRTMSHALRAPHQYPAAPAIVYPPCQGWLTRTLAHGGRPLSRRPHPGSDRALASSSYTATRDTSRSRFRRSLFSRIFNRIDHRTHGGVRVATAGSRAYTSRHATTSATRHPLRSRTPCPLRSGAWIGRSAVEARYRRL